MVLKDCVNWILLVYDLDEIPSKKHDELREFDKKKGQKGHKVLFNS